MRSKNGEFNVSTPVQAARLMEALRHLGHDMNSASAELVDNSLDGKSREIRLYFEGVKGDGSPLDKLVRLVVSDNGKGMDESELTTAFCLGGGKEHKAFDFGRFGMGMLISSLGVARNFTVFTQTVDGPVLKGAQSYDHIQEADEFVSCICDAEADESVEFQNYLPPRAKSGTVAMITNFDSLSHLFTGKKKKGPRTVKAFSNHVKAHLGRVFQHLIEDGISIFINDDEITPADPMLLSLAKSTRPISLKRDFQTLKRDQTYVLLDKEVRFEEPDGTMLPKVRIMAVAAARDLPTGKLSKEDAGFDVFRNRRLIAGKQRIAMPAKSHHEQSLIRGAIFFPGGTTKKPGYDKAFTVQVNKNKILLETWLEDQIEEAVEQAVDFAVKFRRQTRENSTVKPKPTKTKVKGKGKDQGMTPGITIKKGITSKDATGGKRLPADVEIELEYEESEVPTGLKFQNARGLTAREVCRQITRSKDGVLTIRLNGDSEYSEWLEQVLKAIALEQGLTIS